MANAYFIPPSASAPSQEALGPSAEARAEAARVPHDLKGWSLEKLTSLSSDALAVICIAHGLAKVVFFFFCVCVAPGALFLNLTTKRLPERLKSRQGHASSRVEESEQAEAGRREKGEKASERGDRIIERVRASACSRRREEGRIPEESRCCCCSCNCRCRSAETGSLQAQCEREGAERSDHFAASRGVRSARPSKERGKQGRCGGEAQGEF